jgi:hypothetical protein
MGYEDHPNVKAVLDEEDNNGSGNWNITDELIRKKITHLLSIYPKVSPSMLQVGIGPSIAPAMWKPILAQLKDLGLVIETQLQAQTHTGRHQTYTIYELADPESLHKKAHSTTK